MTIEHRLHRAAHELRELEIEPQPFDRGRGGRTRPSRRLASSAPIVLAVAGALGAVGILASVGTPESDVFTQDVPATAVADPAPTTVRAGTTDPQAASAVDGSARPSRPFTAREELTLILNAASAVSDGAADVDPWSAVAGRRLGGPS